jgi:4-hydroxybenzoate polyprenyltransferase
MPKRQQLGLVLLFFATLLFVAGIAAYTLSPLVFIAGLYSLFYKPQNSPPPPFRKHREVSLSQH